MKHFFIVLLIFLIACCTGFSKIEMSNAVIIPDIEPEIELEEEIEAAVEIAAEPVIEEEDLSIFIFEPNSELPAIAFKEVWGYVISGQERALTRGLPITDVVHFSADINSYGTLGAAPNRRNISTFTGRVHLAVTSSSTAATYFALLPGSHQRETLIADLLRAAQNYDGINIDIENIPARSGDAFLSFLSELRDGLIVNGKMLTVALYARTRTIANDVYDYQRIKPLVDRIFVMAYDEHWSGSAPGPISTIRWCRSVADYSMRVVGAEKLIMGMPFYGRAWESENHARAMVYSTIERLIQSQNAVVTRENGTPTFNYQADVNVKVYYEDEYSIYSRMEMYKSMDVTNIGFWRVGQETQRVWNTIKLE